MPPHKRPAPRRHRPRGLEILHEDRDLLVVNKEPGVLTMCPNRERQVTAETALNDYVRKGNARSSKRVFLVHRLDRETSGVLIFARSELAQHRLKDNWPATEKYYLAAVWGHLSAPSGVFSSYLAENADQFVHSVSNPADGRLSQTAYRVISETRTLTFVRIKLLTGRKNQVRVQFAEAGHPVLGDAKYGTRVPFRERLCLHAKSIAFNHPHSGARLIFDTPIPEVFSRLGGHVNESDWQRAAEIRMPGCDTPPRSGASGRWTDE